MKVGDLVIYRWDAEVEPCFSEDCQSSWGLGIVLARTWLEDCMAWENIVWFSDLKQEVVCDEMDLKKVA